MSYKERCQYVMGNGESADLDTIDLSYGAAITTASAVYSAVLELGDRAVVRLILDCTAVTGSDSFDVTVETSRDGYNNWYTAGTFTTVTAVSTERKVFAIDRFVRAKYDGTDAGGGISYTCTLSGEAA